jgi:uncharacterized protein YqjF (DUF2071 family)
MIDLLTSAVRQTAGKREVDHRPWPAPGRPWRLGQTWEHLLFAHWALPSAALAAHVPEQLPLDTRDGCAWLGVTPFLLKALRPIAGPPLPVLSTFPEVNVRTYVTVGGKPGIFFLSLDAASALAVAGGRHFYRLPYFLADMEMDYDGDEVSYRSRRRDARGHPAELELRYRPVSDLREAARDSLEHFLTERYCLYTLDEEKRVVRAEIHHPPWQLQDAAAEIVRNTMPPPPLTLPAGGPLLHYARRQDVLIWGLELV